MAIGPRPPQSFVTPYARWVYAGAGCGASLAEHRAMVFIHFNTLVVRDGIDPLVAHAAFLAIDEYRECVSPEIGYGIRVGAVEPTCTVTPGPD